VTEWQAEGVTEQTGWGIREIFSTKFIGASHEKHQNMLDFKVLDFRNRLRAQNLFQAM